jgi:hypothetical protein
MEEMGVWEGDDRMEFFIINKNLLIKISLHLWRMNTLGLPVKLIIVNDFKFRFLRCSQNQHMPLPFLQCNHNGPTGLSGHAVQICSVLKRN